MRTRLLLAGALCAFLYAQESGVPAIIDGKEVVRVYASVGAFTAEERARAIEDRITTLGEKGIVPKMTTRAIPSEHATAVVADAAIIMVITQKDAELAGATQDELAGRYARAVQDAIAGYRVSHTWLSFLMAVAKTLVAWFVFCLTAWALWKSIGWVGRRMEAWFGRRAVESEGAGFQRLLWERGRLVFTTLLKLVVGLTLLSEFSFVISFTLGLFPQTTGFSSTLLGYLTHTFGSAVMALVEYVPSGGFVVLTVLVTHYVLKVLKFLASAIERGDLPLKGIHPEMAKPTYQLMRLVVVLFALVVVFPYLPGGKSEAFKGVSIFLGLLLSLGSSSAVSNVLAGLVLTYMRPFRPGDRVKIVDTLGDVIEKTLLVTRVRTIKNVEVVIPNSAILNNQILNYSALARTRGLILHTSVTIGYNTPWRTVHELLIRAALQTEGILADPAPFVLETSLNDFHISYELNTYTDQANEIQNIYSRLHECIQDSFNQGGVEIMSPTYYALRDGNTITIPEGDRPQGYEAPAFRVSETASRIMSVPGGRG
jgi:small-conductance mechanosensitive channel